MGCCCSRSNEGKFQSPDDIHSGEINRGYEDVGNLRADGYIDVDDIREAHGRYEDVTNIMPVIPPPVEDEVAEPYEEVHKDINKKKAPVRSSEDAKGVTEVDTELDKQEKSQKPLDEDIRNVPIDDTKHTSSGVQVTEQPLEPLYDDARSVPVAADESSVMDKPVENKGEQDEAKQTANKSESGNYINETSWMMAYDWYHGEMSREDSEKCMKSHPYPRGTFMIRCPLDKGDTSNGKFVLTVVDNKDGVMETTNYKVKRNDVNKFYLSPKLTFASLKELVDHYSSDGSGLCCKLTSPCPKGACEAVPLNDQEGKQWQLPRSALSIGLKIKTGRFGDIHQAQWKVHHDVAVTIAKQDLISHETLCTEIETLVEFHHDNLARVYGASTEEQPYYILTELLENCTLQEYLRGDNSEHLGETELVELATQVASGMDYLEIKQYTHQNLYSGSVFISQNKTAKIADIGMHRVMKDQGKNVPMKWTPPEVFLQEREYSIKSDVWSFGILMVEIFSKGMIPYPGMTNQEVISQLVAGYRHPAPTGCRALIYNQMQKCWDADPDSRPTFYFLHDFLFSQEWQEEEFKISLTSFR